MPTLGVICDTMANTRTKYVVSIFNHSEDVNGFQILQPGHVTQTASISK